MDTSALHSVSVAAVITNDAGEVLMVRRRDNGHWEPPGGVLERNETIIDGLRREVHEETGLTAHIGALTGVYKNMTRGVVALVFRADIDHGETRRSTEEAAALAWIKPAEVTSLCDEAYAIRVLDALAEAPAAIRAHDGVSMLPPSVELGA